MTHEAALYDCFIADYYDSTPILTERTQDVAFYLNAAKKYGGPVLELGCGTGRITIAIAETGLRITGLDLSSRMLARASEKRAALGREVRDRVRLVQGDMTQFDLGEKFRSILIPFRPFQHLLELEQQMACLHCAKRHLTPDGRLIVDFSRPIPSACTIPNFRLSLRYANMIYRTASMWPFPNALPRFTVENRKTTWR